MIIRLIDGYTIEPEPMNYILRCEQTYIGKDEKEKTKNEVIGYCRDLKQAMELFIANLQRDKLADLSVDCFEFVKKVEEVNKTAVSDLCALIERENKDGNNQN